MESRLLSQNSVPAAGSSAALLQLYYFLKPAIPRRLQIMLRNHQAKSLSRRHNDSWPISASSAAPPPYWNGWKDQKQFALILTHDVESQKGYRDLFKLMQIDKEMGFASAFNLVPEKRYVINEEDLQQIKENGFEIGVHGLCHDGKLLQSENTFIKRAEKINHYLEKWEACGFRAPAMHHDLELFKRLHIHYDSSTFDTDPYEPQPDGVNTIFPFYIPDEAGSIAYWELPYTLPQDSTLFIILRKKNIGIWTQKLDWIAENGGMALLNVHPDYINFNGGSPSYKTYPASCYRRFLAHIRHKYAEKYWNPLPRDMVAYLNQTYGASVERAD